MNILHFIPVYKPAWRYGGVVQCVSQLCEALAQQGIHVTVYSTNADGDDVLPVPTDREIDVDGVPVRYFSSIKTPWGIESIALRSEIGSLIGKFDLAHLASVWQPLGPVVASAARKANVPYISSLHGTINSWTWARRRLKHHLYWHLFERRCLARAAALHATCHQERIEAESLGVGLNQEFAEVPNGLHVAEYRRRAELAVSFRDALGIPANRKILLFFGRIHPKKGIDVFLRATAKTLSASPDWVFMIIGPDERGHRAELERLVRDLHLQDNVRFHGMLAGSLRLGAYSAADLFVLTSYNENFGMSVVEAMAASVPVLISNHVGISSEIAQDNAGRVIPMKDTAMQEALADLMASAELRRAYAQRGLECVRRRYDTPVVAKQMADVYQRILAGA